VGRYFNERLTVSVKANEVHIVFAVSAGPEARSSRR
jgi:hypothetical protein